jgi:hypothetical protein
MLTTHFKRPQTPERYRSGPTGPYLDSFTDWLERQGYSSPRIRQLIYGVRQFSRWAQQTDTCLEDLHEKALESFEQYLQNQQRLYYPSGDRSYLFVGARHFVTFLQSTHRVPSLNSTPPPSSMPPLLVEGIVKLLRLRPSSGA